MITVGEKLAFIERVFGRGDLAKNHKNFDVWCPMCAPRDRSKRKLSIRVDDTACHCWTCSFASRTLAPLVKRFGTTAQFQEYCDKVNPNARMNVTTEVEKVVRLPDDFELLAISKSNHPDTKAIRRYVLGRGLTEDDLWFYGFGSSREQQWRRRVLIPSFSAEGRLNYLVGRAIDDTAFKRYDNVDVIRKSVIFNEINIDWKSRLALCEGPFDYVKCGQNAVPMLGKTLNEDSLLFCEIVTHNTPVAVALDAGEVAARDAIVKKLERYGVDVTVVDVSPFKDPGEMTKQEFASALQRASKVDWFGSFVSRLDRVSGVRLGRLDEDRTDI